MEDQKFNLSFNLKKHFFSALLFLIGLFLCGKIFYLNYSETRLCAAEGEDQQNVGVTGLITSEQKFRQYFIPDDATKAMAIKFATYETEPEGDYKIDIYLAENDELVCETDIEGKKIEDNQWYTVIISNTLNADTEYYFTVTAIENEGDTVAIWKEQKTEENAPVLYNNGTPTDEELSYKLMSKSKADVFIFIAMVLFLVLTIISVFQYKINDKAASVVILLIYVVLLVFFVFKGAYYVQNWIRTPDDVAHRSYVLDVYKNGFKFLPDFEDMVDYNTDSPWNTTGIIEVNRTNMTTYLAHPPLYYFIMSHTGSIDISNGHIYINVTKLGIINLFLVTLSISLIFYIGFTRIVKDGRHIIQHMLYGAVCISVPMMTGVACGINNDNILYLWFALFLLGVLRYYEGKAGILTYALIAVSITGGLLSKLTLGEILVVSAVAVALTEIIREHNFKIILNKSFFCTLWIYIPAALYYLMLYLKYNSLQPRIKQLNPEQYLVSSWYVDEAHRTHYSFFRYIKEFLNLLKDSWSALYNNFVSLYRPLGNIGNKEFAFIVVPAIIIFIWVFIKLFSKKDLKENKVFFTIGAALIITLITNFIFSYSEYIDTGRFGDCQGRYYLCAIPFFALGFSALFSAIKSRFFNKSLYAAALSVDMVCAAYLLTLLYNDFPYYYITYFSNL